MPDQPDSCCICGLAAPENLDEPFWEVEWRLFLNSTKPWESNTIGFCGDCVPAPIKGDYRKQRR